MVPRRGDPPVLQPSRPREVPGHIPAGGRAFANGAHGRKLPKRRLRQGEEVMPKTAEFKVQVYFVFYAYLLMS